MPGSFSGSALRSVINVVPVSGVHLEKSSTKASNAKGTKNAQGAAPSGKSKRQSPYRAIQIQAKEFTHASVMAHQ